MSILTKRLCLFFAALCLTSLPALACPTGKPVEIEWNGGEFPGMVLDGPDAQGNCLVSYDGYDETWNEWVGIERLANLDVAGTAPPPPPAPPSACPIGASRQIEWNGSQWDGTILDGPNAAGECFVTYDGWDESWNEWVAQARIEQIEAVVPVAVSCPTGASRQIEWNGSLWDGTILEGPNAAGECFVTYDGWDASWNEWVGQDRITPFEVAAPVAPTCPVGETLEIQWNDSWWDGTVLQGPDAQGQCLVTYEGWDASWNEWVTTDRLRDAD